MTKATSNYKQVRVTLTEQRSPGRPDLVDISVRIMVKPQNAEWHQRHTMLVTEARQLQPLASLDEVYAALLEVLAAPPLPGHIG